MEFNVIDAGARYGVHPSWENIKELINLFLFEVDNEEAKRLKNKYKKLDNIKVSNIGLSNKKEEIFLNINEHKALSSLLDINKKELEYFNHMVEETNLLNKNLIQTDTIDNLFSDIKIDFLKLDVEGYEKYILEGASIQLDNILAIRSEVIFIEFHKKGTTFSELHSFLTKKGFELLNLDYNGKGYASSIFTKSDRYGTLISTDAVWIKKRDIIFKEKDLTILTENVIKYAVFLMNNNASDIALKFLLEAISLHKINFSAYSDCKVFLFLDKEIQLLFKNISEYPYINIEDLKITYKSIFKKEFKTKNDFYENPIFE